MSSNRDRIPDRLRKAVGERARGYCEYCCTPEAYCPDGFTVDHIIPCQAGGATTLENLAWSCFGCNACKHTKTSHLDPQTREIVALFNPRVQLWSEHFEWSQDLTRAIGKTPCGRATVEALKLNRVGVVNLRRLLVTASLHPPTEN